MSTNVSINSTSYEIQAYAKINLMLEIISDREDGYHEIKSILQTLNLADRVRVIHDGLGRVEVDGPYKFDVPTDEKNLAYQALLKLADLHNFNPTEFSIEITKNIPPAAGLGGGSSDAVAVLKLLLKYFPLISEFDIAKIATSIGSDEAFFLNGGTALVGGRGEVVEQLIPLPKHDVVLFVPELHISKKTQRMFEFFKGETFDSGERSLEFASSLPRNIDSKELFNSFERVAFTFFQGLQDLKVNIEKMIQAPIHLTGAGPTLFWIGMDVNSVQGNFRDLNLPCQIIQTSTFSEPGL